MPLGPTFAPATDDTAASDEVDIATDDDGKRDGFPLAPTFATEKDGAAGSDEVIGARKILSNKNHPSTMLEIIPCYIWKGLFSCC